MGTIKTIYCNINDHTGDFGDDISYSPDTDMEDILVNNSNLRITLENLKILNGYIQIGQKSGTDIGAYATAEGSNTTASGTASRAEGYNTTASGTASHAEGYNTTASGIASHAEGYQTTASGDYSHAEGHNTTASGIASHAEGYQTTASGDYSHAEGYITTASSDYSHAEGYYTIASGTASHAEGYYTIASYKAQYVCGKYNYDSPSLFTIGNGSSSSNRSNAFTILSNGDMIVGNEGNQKFFQIRNRTTENSIDANSFYIRSMYTDTYYNEKSEYSSAQVIIGGNTPTNEYHNTGIDDDTFCGLCFIDPLYRDGYRFAGYGIFSRGHNKLVNYRINRGFFVKDVSTDSSYFRKNSTFFSTVESLQNCEYLLYRALFCNYWGYNKDMIMNLPGYRLPINMKTSTQLAISLVID